EVEIYINGQLVAEEGEEFDGVNNLNDYKSSSGGESFDDSDSEYEYKMHEDKDDEGDEGDKELIDNVVKEGDERDNDGVNVEEPDAEGLKIEDTEFEQLSGDENIVWSEDELNSNKGSDEDEDKGETFPVFNPSCMFHPHFELGMIFSTKKEFRTAVQSHAIETKRNIKFTKNDKKRVHAKCFDKDCPWRIHACRLKGSPSAQYALLGDYADEIKRSNPGSTVVLGIDDSDGVNLFDRFYEDCKYTFMSDKQKGLVGALEELFPNAEHRFCVRHLHSNFKIFGFRGLAFKNGLWKAARATTVNQFNARMQELKELDEGAYAWFSDKHPKGWSRSHFSTYPRCDILLNNAYECLNSNILEARNKTILSMLEWLMEYFMKRLQVNKDRTLKIWKKTLCPKIQKIIDKNIEKLGDCIPIKSDDKHYQISCFDGTQYSVDLENGTCGCRKWDLSGIPCKHVVSAIFYQGEGIEKYTHQCYRVQTFLKAYQHAVLPVNGREE
ncbi:UNVERIFIED_CONTAM: hypothetical protein Sindi_0715500, partial [Sesamum indicum]